MMILQYLQFVDNVYSILKCTHLEKFFHHINNLNVNIKPTLEEDSNRELALLHITETE